MFKLHHQLAADTHVVGHFPLSLLLLCKDANYPWCILVPKQEEIREIHQLNKEDRQQLLDESCALAEVMESLYQPVKMNVAALGNMVPQLHIHHIARFKTDPAWPGPIWGKVSPSDYSVELLGQRIQDLRSGLINKEIGFRG